MPHAVQLSPTLSSYESEDEVVWSLSDSSLSFSALSSAGLSSAPKGADNDGTSDDDDFVLLDKPCSIKAVRSWSDLISDSELSDSQGKAADRSTTATATDVVASQNGSTFLTSVADVQKTPKKVDVQLEPLPEARRTAVPPVLVKKKKKKKITAKDPSPPSGVASSPKQGRRRKKAQKQQPAAQAPATLPNAGKSSPKGKKARKAAKAVTPSTKSVALPKEEEKDVAITETPAEMYKEASLFITSFLENPVAKQDQVCRLTLLQSLIVEFGLASTSLPTSLRAARAFLKARVFINIRDYLAHRAEGQTAIQRLLLPNKAALIKDVRRKGHAVPRKWVKEQGLQVLLVPCYSH